MPMLTTCTDGKKLHDNGGRDSLVMRMGVVELDESLQGSGCEWREQEEVRGFSHDVTSPSSDIFFFPSCSR